MRQRGFTLVEVLVTIALFAFVVVISISSVLTILRGNERTQNEATVVNNLQSGVEEMVRTIRDGHTFHCGDNSGSAYTVSRTCAAAGETTFAVLPIGATFPTVFRYNATNQTIERSTDGGSTFEAITAAPAAINLLKFYNTAADSSRAQILVVIAGTTGSGSRSATSFSLQTTIAERLSQVKTSSAVHNVSIKEN